MSVTITDSVPENEWRRFVDGHPEGNIFHTPEMFQVFSRAKKHRPAVWAAVADGQMLALFLPVRITLFGGLLSALTTRDIVYGSVLCVPGREGQDAAQTLLRTYVGETKGVLFTELRNVSDLTFLQPVLEQCGFRYEEQLNYLIDLNRPPDEVLQSFGQRTRKRIRHGLREGTVTMEEIDRRERVALCYELLRQSYNAAQVPLADLSLFEAAFDLLYPKGMIKFLLAWVGDKCAAGSAELVYKDMIYGWYAGVDRSFSTLAPGELLMWHILQWGAANGYRVYDFGGAGRSNQKYGVRDFKSKFGGDLVSYGRNIRVHLPLALQLSKVGYQILRPLL